MDYLKAAADYRQTHCEGVTCSPVAVPPAAGTDCCATLARCVDEACVLGCDDTALGVPKVSDDSMECQEFREKLPE